MACLVGLGEQQQLPVREDYNNTNYRYTKINIYCYRNKYFAMGNNTKTKTNKQKLPVINTLTYLFLDSATEINSFAMGNNINSIV